MNRRIQCIFRSPTRLSAVTYIFFGPVASVAASWSGAILPRVSTTCASGCNAVKKEAGKLVMKLQIFLHMLRAFTHRSTTPLRVARDSPAQVILAKDEALIECQQPVCLYCLCRPPASC